MKKIWIVLALLLALVCVFASCDKEEAEHTHTYGDWSVSKAATCAAKGEEKRTCKCGESEVREISAGGEHTYDAENTCTECLDYKDKGVEFTLQNGTYTVSAYTGDAGEVIIPTKYKNVPVTCIGKEAFYNCTSVRQVTIPDSVTTIEDFAFFQCGLRDITIPEGVISIGRWAFAECMAVGTITIPNSVTSIGDSAFRKCKPTQYTVYQNGEYWGNSNNPYLYLADVADKTVTSFSISEQTKFIGNSAFFQCYSLESITIPGSVTGIDSQAFFACTKLKTVTFASNTNLTAIGFSAFNSCKALQSIAIPASVKKLGSGVFEKCTSLSSVIFDKNSGWWVERSAAATSGATISATDLADTSRAAEYLTTRYVDYYWFRSE